MERKVTGYYRDHSSREHGEFSEETAWAIIDDPEYVEVQEDGRIRYYGIGTFRDGSRTMYARLITEPDGSLLNIFPDHDFPRRLRRMQN